ncbi:PBSX family phage terminase large subunit [Megasphaera sp. NM10]|jgi:PBSX family phage terminase large subunit|uniref:PBSX family phage terminase large subunit n=1 Tax=Megasphaera sp. NM10 TaxID=1273103 RepID=UPI000356EE50|nr:PBSX family phage terminase large subunit [Megasphaera sp. NM10]EPP17835.1 phage terminase large subunit [Megasphaera sp. NM10]
MKTIRLSDIIAPHFWDLHQDIKQHGHTYYWLEGGRGSTKSSDVSVEIPQLIIKNPECHAVVLRKIGNTIKNSVYPQMQWGIDALGLTDKFRFKTSPHEITYKKTGQKILFFGVDDPQKIKSIKLPFGYVGICWIEELDQFSGMEEIRNLNQSLLRGGPVFWEFCSFNPPKSQNNWVNEEKLFDDPDRLVHHSTYLGVPREWLGDRFFEDAEKLKERNETAYRHEYLGEVTGTGGVVFENVEDMAMSNELVGNFDRLYYGLDFGFAVDPLAYVAMYYDAKREDLYIFDELYRQKMTNSQAAKAIKLRINGGRILADAAEPKSIAEMSDYGLRISGARKGPDSIDFGMRWLQNRAHIYIDKRRCPNTYKEFVTYEYDRNKDGQFVSAYPDANNHSIDAVRYGLSEIMNRDKIVSRRVNF